MSRRDLANETSKKGRIVNATTEEPHDRESDGASNSGFTEHSELIPCQIRENSMILNREAALEGPTVLV